MKFQNKTNNNWDLIEAIIILMVSIFAGIGAFIWDFSNYKANVFVMGIAYSAFIGSIYLIYSHLKNK